MTFSRHMMQTSQVHGRNYILLSSLFAYSNDSDNFEDHPPQWLSRPRLSHSRQHSRHLTKEATTKAQDNVRKTTSENEIHRNYDVQGYHRQKHQGQTDHNVEHHAWTDNNDYHKRIFVQHHGLCGYTFPLRSVFHHHVFASHHLEHPKPLSGLDSAAEYLTQ